MNALAQLPLPMAPERGWGFDTVVTGANAAAIAQLRALAVGQERGLAYLWGDEGVGKTRLLQATAAEHRASKAVAQPAWFGADTPAPWPLPEAASLLLLDDADALDAAQQHAAFTLFIEAQSRGLALVAAGRLPPVDLPLREDVRSRLGWGVVHHLQPLTEPELQAEMQAEARRRGMALPAEVLGWLLRRQRRDLGTLMRLLDRLDRYTLAAQRPPTIPLLRRMLETQDHG